MNGCYQQQSKKTHEVRSASKLPLSTKNRIEQLAVAARRTKTFVIEEAINHYLALNEWQIESIQDGLRDLEEGNVMSQESMIELWERKIAGTVD